MKENENKQFQITLKLKKKSHELKSCLNYEEFELRTSCEAEPQNKKQFKRK